MPQPTAVRTLNRSFGLSGLTKKPTKHRLEPETYDDVSYVDIGERISSRGTMDRLSSKDVLKNLHLPGRSSSPTKHKSKSSPKLAPAKPAKLDIQIESPPLILHGTPAQSTGALLSGQLLLTVTDADVKIETYSMSLQVRIATKKPVAKDCPECTTKASEIHSWNFLSEATHFKQGTRGVPFSHLLKGHLPAACHGNLGRMDYVLAAKATTAHGDIISVEHPLSVLRALMPGPDRTSERIFPPTNLRAHVITPSVIHPIGAFPVQMRLTGLMDSPQGGVQRRWRVRKINWRIEEHSRIISAACLKHAHKVGGEGKGILHEDTRTIGKEDLQLGWKTDFDTPGGQIELEFNSTIDATKHAICDVESSNGLSSSHNLVMEIIVSEEQIVLKGNKYPTPTGNARVLRMQFKLVLTERAGLGISWDEETPPMYEDVDRSPPGYTKIEDYDGDLAQLPGYEELEGMRDLQIEASSAQQDL